MTLAADSYRVDGLLAARAICAGIHNLLTSGVPIPPDLLAGYIVIVERAPSHQALCDVIGGEDWHVGSPRAWAGRGKVTITKTRYAQARAQAVARECLAFRALDCLAQDTRVREALLAFEEAYRLPPSQMPAGWASKSKVPFGRRRVAA